MVQETYLRAWRGFGGFDGRSSLRRWLYKIATMACLTALDRRSRRPLPSGLGAPSDDHRVTVAARDPSVAWLQRAVLTLRDVLGFRTAEVAQMLGTTATAVDSALRRALARLAQAGPAEDDLAEPDERDRRELVDRYVDAFTRADPGALVGLLRADAEMEMPPIPTWFTGQGAVVGFLASRVMRRGRWRLVPTRANGQAAVVVYRTCQRRRDRHPFGF